MKVIGSVVEEQGVKFAVVLVKKYVVDSQPESNKMIQSLTPSFGGLPIVLAAQDEQGKFTYYGREDISKFLASIDPTRIPWNEYSAT